MNKYLLWVSKVIWQLHIAQSLETNIQLLGNSYSHHDCHDSTPLGPSISQLSSWKMFISIYVRAVYLSGLCLAFRVPKN